MKAILFLLGGVLAAFLFIYWVRTYYATPERIFFFTVEVEGKGREEVLEDLIRKIREKGLGVVGVIDISNDYTLVLSCDVPWKGDLLRRVPSLSSLVPCPIAVYRSKGKVYITVPKEIYFVQDHREDLGQDYADTLTRMYQAVRIVIGEVAAR